MMDLFGGSLPFQISETRNFVEKTLPKESNNVSVDGDDPSLSLSIYNLTKCITKIIWLQRYSTLLTTI